jgi:hypothetical protein
MDKQGFSEYLKLRGQSGGALAASRSEAQEFEAFLAQRGTHGAAAGRELAEAYADRLFTQGRDSEGTLLALARYARFNKNRETYLAFLARLDGSEVMGNFRRWIGDKAGTEAQRRIFTGLKLPTPCAGNRERARVMRVALDRAQEALPPGVLEDILLGCLHDLPDEPYLPLREKRRAAGSFETFIRQRREDFLDEMARLHREGELYYNQPVTDAVLAFLREREDVSVGIYSDGVLRITKIPYMADEWLKKPTRCAGGICTAIAPGAGIDIGRAGCSPCLPSSASAARGLSASPTMCCSGAG